MLCDTAYSCQSTDTNNAESCYNSDEYYSSGNKEEYGETEELDIFESFDLRVGNKILCAIRKTDEKLYGEETSTNYIERSETKRKSSVQYRDDSSRYNKPPDLSLWCSQFQYLRVRGNQVMFQKVYNAPRPPLWTYLDDHAGQENTINDNCSAKCEFASTEEIFAIDGCVDESPVGQVMDDDSTNVATEIAPTSRTLTGDLCIVIDDVKVPVSDPHESIAEAASSTEYAALDDFSDQRGSEAIRQGTTCNPQLEIDAA